MNTFHLEILTPERVFFTGECTSLMVPISDGMLGIMANREPITAAVGFGEAFYKTENGEKIIFSVSGGMIDVLNNTVKLLCETAYLPDEINEAKVLEEAEMARLALSKKQSHKEYLLSKLMLTEAVNKLKIKHKKH